MVMTLRSVQIEYMYVYVSVCLHAEVGRRGGNEVNLEVRTGYLLMNYSLRKIQ